MNFFRTTDTTDTTDTTIWKPGLKVSTCNRALTLSRRASSHVQRENYHVQKFSQVERLSRMKLAYYNPVLSHTTDHWFLESNG